LIINVTKVAKKINSNKRKVKKIYLSTPVQLLFSTFFTKKRPLLTIHFQLFIYPLYTNRPRFV